MNCCQASPTSDVRVNTTVCRRLSTRDTTFEGSGRLWTRPKRLKNQGDVASRTE